MRQSDTMIIILITDVISIVTGCYMMLLVFAPFNCTFVLSCDFYILWVYNLWTPFATFPGCLAAPGGDMAFVNQAGLQNYRIEWLQSAVKNRKSYEIDRVWLKIAHHPETSESPFLRWNSAPFWGFASRCESASALPHFAGAQNAGAGKVDKREQGESC